MRVFLILTNDRRCAIIKMFRKGRNSNEFVSFFSHILTVNHDDQERMIPEICLWKISAIITENTIELNI